VLNPYPDAAYLIAMGANDHLLELDLIKREQLMNNSTQKQISLMLEHWLDEYGKDLSFKAKQALCPVRDMLLAMPEQPSPGVFEDRQ
jgi:predicted component of type VI protein secretion system